MATDAALLWAAEAGEAPPTVRVYEWDGTWLSLGRFQTADRGVQVAECSRLGVRIVRRPTGGRGVLHGSDVTVTLCVPYAAVGVGGGSVASLYRWCGEALVQGLRGLVPAVEVGGVRYVGRGGDCFASATAADLCVGGAKLVGSAQRRGQAAALVQMSLMWRPPPVDPAALFGDAAPGRYPLSGVPRQALVGALLRGIEGSARMTLVHGGLTVRERAWAEAEEARGAFDPDAPMHPV